MSANRKSSRLITPIRGSLTIVGWHGTTSTEVEIVGSTPKRFRIRALTRTRLAGPCRWLEVGEETLVPTSAVRVLHGETLAAIRRAQDKDRAQ